MESFGLKMIISSQPVPLTGTGVLYPRVRDFSVVCELHNWRSTLEDSLSENWKSSVFSQNWKVDIFFSNFDAFNICSLPSFNHAFHKCPGIWMTTNQDNLNIFDIYLQNKQILLGHLIMITLYKSPCQIFKKSDQKWVRT